MFGQLRRSFGPQKGRPGPERGRIFGFSAWYGTQFGKMPAALEPERAVRRHFFMLLCIFCVLFVENLQKVRRAEKKI